MPLMPDSPLATACVVLRDALTEVLHHLDEATRPPREEIERLTLICRMTRQVLELREMQIQIELARLGYLFADEVAWALYGHGRGTGQSRPTPAELAEGLAELQALTQATHALSGVEEGRHE